MKRLLAVFILAFLALRCEPAPTSPAAQPATDLTFFVISDSHLGAQNVEPRNREMIAQLNRLPGTPYPSAIGGKVATPCGGVLHLGDLTDSGTDEQWQQFVGLYGLTGHDALLKYPLYETYGNHDNTGGPVPDRVRQRHGGLPYSWDWDGVHFVCLGSYPDAEDLRFLRADLAKLAGQRPIILYLHYAIEGPYSEIWKTEQKEAFAQAIEGQPILAIFHGHYHMAGHYVWHGHDVYLPGSPRHNSHQFIVVRIRDSKMTVAWWDWDTKSFRSEQTRSINLHPTATTKPAEHRS